jgi:hypothetical protein
MKAKTMKAKTIRLHNQDDIPARYQTGPATPA